MEQTQHDAQSLWYKKEFLKLHGADYFHLLLFYYREGEPGIAKLKGVEQSIREMIKIRLGPSQDDSS